MRYLTFALCTALALPAALAAEAQSANQLICQDMVMNITGQPPEAGLSLTISAADILKQCTSSTGAALTLVSPVGGVTIATVAGGTVTAPFIVQDANGASATANIIVTRN